MCDFILKLKEILPEGDFKANEPLSLHSTFRIGGNADIFAKPSSEMYLVKLLKTAKENDIPYTVVGGGSNILFSDKGFKGLVITTQGLKNISSRDTFVTAESGVALPMLSSFLCRRGLGGMSFACGIPGTVGGGVFMNAGAYGGEFADVLVSSRYYDCISGKICEIANSEHNFSYRHSSYMEHSERVILSAEFSLDKGSSEVIKNECDELLRRRAEKQPLEFPSAGSTFKRYPGFFTAQLIDECGLKGYSVGGAQVSEKHAGFVINRGGASASDVMQLVEHIKKVIFDRHGIEIECEIRFVGEK